MIKNNRDQFHDKTVIDGITASFFDVFTNIDHKQPAWSLIYDLCIPETLIIKKTEEAVLTYDLERFIENAFGRDAY